MKTKLPGGMQTQRINKLAGLSTGKRVERVVQNLPVGSCSIKSGLDQVLCVCLSFHLSLHYSNYDGIFQEKQIQAVGIFKLEMYI